MAMGCGASTVTVHSVSSPPPFLAPAISADVPAEADEAEGLTGLLLTGADDDPYAADDDPYASDDATAGDTEPAGGAPETAAPATPKASPAPASDQSKRERLYAPAGLVRIHHKPDRESPIIGAIRAGQSVRVTNNVLSEENKLKRKFQCSEGWYPVAPRGWVCAGGGNNATWRGDDPRVIAARAVLPDTSKAYPFHYGTSVGAPQYLRIPTAKEQRQAEPALNAHLADLPKEDRKKGGRIDNTPANQAPSAAWLAYEKSQGLALRHKDDAFKGMKVAWTRQFDANGRTWLVTPDMTLIPKDKVRISELPKLRGIDLSKRGDVKLPLLFTWLNDSNIFQLGADGKLHKSDKQLARHSFASTTTKQMMGPGGLYWELSDGGWLPYRDVSLIRPSKRRPRGLAANEKWVEVRVTWGYLIAYRGDKPVYVTAISPGIDGIAARSHATARGRHYVDWKLISADMSGTDKQQFWLVDEVPWVQYYKGNFAFHGAWWHNDFGRPKSHGCVNISPPDAKHLFEWMDPPLPQGWYAASAHWRVKGTLIYIRA